MGGGGTFRLFPLGFMKTAIAQVCRKGGLPAAMLYFHPWEFDQEQQQLPLRGVSRFRTYNGISASRGRLDRLLSEGRTFVRAIDLVEDLGACADKLPRFAVEGAAARRRREPADVG
jgi:hypothetical protein